MNPADPNLQRVEIFATALGSLCDEMLDGRPRIETEVAEAPDELSAYLAMRFRAVLGHPEFNNTLPGLVVFDELYDARITAVLQRATAIANLKKP